MARSRGNSVETAVLQLIALLVVGCVFSPFFRGLLLWAVLTIFAAFAVVIVYRLSTRRRRIDWAARPNTGSMDFNRSSLNVVSPISPASFARVIPVENRELKSLDWFQFEKLVAALYEQQGYSGQRSGGANPDGGIDLVVTNNGVTSAVQCKHWKGWKVGVKQIREFLGALADRGIQSGIFVTLQEYTDEAKELASRHNIQLIGEIELMQMLETANWRFNPAITSIMNDTRKLCPKCESEMVLRTAKKGSNVGSQFWGCSGYPRCRFVMNLN